MNRTLQILFLFLLITACGLRSGFSQCCPVPNAVAGLRLSYVQSGGTNASGVAYNPSQNLYYAVIAGNSGFPYETFDAAGIALFQTNAGFDFRGLWWNPNLNQVEGNGFSTFGLWTSNLDGSGNALNTGTNIFTGQNQPDAQSCGDLNYDDNEIIYYFNGAIHRYRRSTNAFIGTLTLTGMPVPLSSINSTSVVYTGCAGHEFALQDHVNKRIYFFNKATGAFSGASQLPASAVTNSMFRFSYANDLVWLYDLANRTWHSYRVLTTGINVDLGNDTTLCQGEILLLDVTAPNATYLWQDNSTNPAFMVITAGIYWVDVTVNNCTQRDSIQVDFTPFPVVNLGNDTTLCQSEILFFDATTPNATYLWQDSSANSTYTVNVAGVYWVDVTINSCTVRDSIQVNYNPLPIVNLGNDTTLCQGETFQLHATILNATYLWQDNSTNATFTVSTTGIYWVDVTINNCTTRDSVQVDYTPLPVFDLGNDSTLCQGEILQLDATTVNAAYLWQDSSASSTFPVTTAGIYWVDVTVNNCSTRDSVQIDFNPLPAVNLGDDTTLCQGEALLLDAATAQSGTFLWQDNSTEQIFTVNAAGVYWADVTVNNCTTRDSIQIDYTPLPVVNLGADTTLCQGETLQLDVTTANATYRWQDNSTNSTFTVTANGIYSVEVTVNNCSASDTIAVTYSQFSGINLADSVTLCAGDILRLDVFESGASYNWQDGSTNSFFDVTVSGLYWVEVTVGNCSVTDSIIVVQGEPVVIVIDSVFDVIAGSEIVLEPEVITGAGNATYAWAPPDGLSCTDCLNPITTPQKEIQYTLTISNRDSCSAIKVITILIRQADLFIPSAFSPNGDGFNDQFEVLTSDVTALDFYIFNRWGELVFESHHPNIGWDGTFKDEPAPVGVYAFYAGGIIGGKKVEKRGSVTLVR